MLCFAVRHLSDIPSPSEISRVIHIPSTKQNHQTIEPTKTTKTPPILPTPKVKSPTMPQIVRLTLFKIPDEPTLTQAISKYATLTRDAVKVRFEFLSLSPLPSKHDANALVHPIPPHPAAHRIVDMHRPFEHDRHEMSEAMDSPHPHLRCAHAIRCMQDRNLVTYLIMYAGAWLDIFLRSRILVLA
jgi:hypothetical protein